MATTFSIEASHRDAFHSFCLNASHIIPIACPPPQYDTPTEFSVMEWWGVLCQHLSSTPDEAELMKLWNCAQAIGGDEGLQSLYLQGGTTAIQSAIDALPEEQQFP